MYLQASSLLPPPSSQVHLPDLSLLDGRDRFDLMADRLWNQTEPHIRHAGLYLYRWFRWIPAAPAETGKSGNCRLQPHGRHAEVSSNHPECTEIK